jgi:hypothetical protein
MKRFVIILLSCGACAGLFWTAWSKGHELSELRSREQAILTGESQQQAPIESPATQPAVSLDTTSTNTPELLQLRGEVVRLELRKKELLSARAENERLKTQLASMATNSSPELPPDYIRTSKAQDRGFGTPQATLETFLWAGQNRNLERLLQCFTPERSAQIAPGNGSQHYFDQASQIPGFRIVRTNTPEGTDFVIAYIEVIPGVEHPNEMAFKVINGEWKLEGF